MTRVVGIDPGTVSFDLVGLEGDRVLLDCTIPTTEVAEDPGVLVAQLTAALPLDLITGASGYGLPLVPIERLTDREILLAFLPGDPSRGGGIRGLRAAVAAMREARLPVVLLPGVVHLPTVPRYRKANRIDLGTADKVCAAALAIEDQARRLGLSYEETSLILVEVGGAFSAVLIIEDGRIVDGVGGSSGPLGFRAMGAMDGELAYLLGPFSKDVLFTGGAAYIADSPTISPEELGLRSDPSAREARVALVESLLKAVAAALAIVPRPREILLSGRAARAAWLASDLEDVLDVPIPMRRVQGLGTVATEAAQGAALLADGIAGGAHRGLVETLQIAHASGTVLDHLYVSGTERLRKTLVG